MNSKHNIPLRRTQFFGITPQSALLLFLLLPSVTHATGLVLWQPEMDGVRQSPSGGASFEGSVLRGNGTPERDFPSVTLRPETGVWNLTPHAAISVAVTNTSDTPVALRGRVLQEDATAEIAIKTAEQIHAGKAKTKEGAWHEIRLGAGEKGILELEFRRPPDRETEEIVKDLRNKRGGSPLDFRGDAIDPAVVTGVRLYFPTPATTASVTLHSVSATGTYDPRSDKIDPETFFPWIDTFGQYKHREWPGKTQSESDLIASREAEAQQLLKSAAPPSWNQYGGWAAGPQLKATGRFRFEKYKGKWFFVDPEGRLYWSNGVNAVRLRSGDVQLPKTKFPWFEGIQSPESALGRAARDMSHEINPPQMTRKPDFYSFYPVNFARKYGTENHRETFASMMPKRLRLWGLNSIGNWSDIALFKGSRIPYVITIESPLGKNTTGDASTAFIPNASKLPDPFSPDHLAAWERQLENLKKGGYLDDPWCLGIFTDNENGWRSEMIIPESVIRAPEAQPAKVALLEMLQQKYVEIGKLNAAWKTDFASWDALAANRDDIDGKSMGEDASQYTALFADQYFSRAKTLLDTYAPGLLNLGVRYHVRTPSVVRANAKYADAISWNHYGRSPAAPGDFKELDKPVLIGEYHFGAADRGLATGGINGTVEDQAARVRAARHYLGMAIRDSHTVGAHWFTFVDQSIAGRYLDREAFQIGLVDICDRPYEDLIAMFRKEAETLYETRLGIQQTR